MVQSTPQRNLLNDFLYRVILSFVVLFFILFTFLRRFRLWNCVLFLFLIILYMPFLFEFKDWFNNFSCTDIWQKLLRTLYRSRGSIHDFTLMLQRQYLFTFHWNIYLHGLIRQRLVFKFFLVILFWRRILRQRRWV